jgi:membrane-bound lytic murein transglycosylase D
MCTGAACFLAMPIPGDAAPTPAPPPVAPAPTRPPATATPPAAAPASATPPAPTNAGSATAASKEPAAPATTSAAGGDAAPAAAPDDGAADEDLDDVQAADAIGIQDNLNAGKKELEDLLKAESKAIDLPAATPQHLNRLGPGNPLQARTSDANHAGGHLFDAAVPPPEDDAGSLLAELNGLDLAALKAEYDIPIEINDDVVEYVRFFQGPGRKWYERWLARSHRWIPIMRPILAEEGVPLDLVYLAMIESGFSPFAYSWARASGFWQFIGETGRRYGLRDDFWVDERRDPLLSTRAAARYLKFLHQDLGDWYLAWASYNAGEGKILKAMRIYGFRDFWDLAHAGRYLRKETKHYVPKLIAAALIAKHPERFGFSNTEEEGPFVYDQVDVDDATDLQVVARASGAPIETLQQMNPSLRRWCTPPAHNGQGYAIRIPSGSKDTFATQFSKIEPSDRLTFRYHRVAPGESIGTIAKKFATQAADILKMNGIASAKKLRKGTDLIIPISTEVAGKFPDGGIAWSEPRVGRHGRHGRVVRGAAVRVASADLGPRTATQTASGRKYVVRSGDSLWAIARQFGIEVAEIKRWNNITGRGSRALQVGRALRVSPPRKAENATPRKGRG